MLNGIIDNRINGKIIRAKAQFVESNEKNSKYFSSLEKKRSESKILRQLNVNGTIINNQSNILLNQKTFYENLYKKREQIPSSYNFFNNNTKLENEHKQSCEGLLTEVECANSLKLMNNNKSPGSDGLTTEFYKIFWTDVKQYLIQSLNYSYTHGDMTDLQKQSIITLLPKGDKDRTFLSNWRPISLLNVDYKIATKSIANRLKKVISNIISNAQTGFVKGRYIGENIRLMCEIIEYVNENDLPALLFFSDFEKAFDSLNHDFMFDTLRHFNFGESLIDWIKLFYKDATSCVTNNGYLSSFFEIQRGVRQGCPLSPTLFIMCIELLSYEVSNNKDIKGINIHDEEIKNTLFADDATFLTDGSDKSFKTLVNVLDNFSYCSGLKLNTKKCNILRAGSLKSSSIVYCKDKNFQWKSDSAKALGMVFYNDVLKTSKHNIDIKVEDFKNCLKQWQHRKLTLMGKITVVKNLAFPKLVYPLTVLTNISDEIIKEIINLMFHFIWDNKPDKIKRTVLCQDYYKGGLKMLDLKKFISSLKSSWIKRILDKNNQGQWKKIYLHKLKKYGSELIFECN